MIDVENDEELKPIIKRYVGKVYALVFYLIGNDSDKAYQIVTSSYVETFMSVKSLEDEDKVLVKLIQEAIKQSHSVEIMPSTSVPPFKDVSPQRIKILHILSNALQAMSFKDKALLLLRDQLHLSYQNIGTVLGVSQNDARSHINQARIAIRKKVEMALL